MSSDDQELLKRRMVLMHQPMKRATTKWIDDCLLINTFHTHRTCLWGGGSLVKRDLSGSLVWRLLDESLTGSLVISNSRMVKLLDL